MTREEQQELIDQLKAEERDALARLEVEAQARRDELAAAYSERWDQLWKSLGYRRDRSTPEAMKKGRVKK
jgi:hypothetical protein